MGIVIAQKDIAAIKWWHKIDLGNGMITPGIDESAERLRIMRMPDDLSGMTVLDIGAWDGFFSFEAERRGARRVLATASFAWTGAGLSARTGRLTMGYLIWLICARSLI